MVVCCPIGSDFDLGPRHVMARRAPLQLAETVALVGPSARPGTLLLLNVHASALSDALVGAVISAGIVAEFDVFLEASLIELLKAGILFKSHGF